MRLYFYPVLSVLFLTNIHLRTLVRAALRYKLPKPKSYICGFGCGVTKFCLLYGPLLMDPERFLQVS